MHPLATLVLRRCLLLGLLAGSLGACQRANYQFRPAGSVAQQVVAPVLPSESAVVTVAAPPLAAAPVESHRRVWLRALHRSARPRLARVLAPRVFAQPVATARLAAPSARRQEPGPVAKPVRYRSRGIAILLAALALTYLPLSLHNFYLGYYGRGAAAIALVIAGASLTVLSLVAGLFSGGGLLLVGVVGLVMLGVWFLWQLSDLVRIIIGDLKPKDGEYNPRLFQTSPSVGSTPPPRTN